MAKLSPVVAAEYRARFEWWTSRIVVSMTFLEYSNRRGLGPASQEIYEALYKETILAAHYARLAGL